MEAAQWGDNILFWYSLSVGLITLTSFQYYLQFVYGKLKMHLIYHLIALFIFSPLLAWITYHYGAIGAAVTWFIFMLFSFLVWTGFVHKIFAPGLHLKWLREDILPVFLATTIYLVAMHRFEINLEWNRAIIFMMLLLIGAGLLLLNTIVSKIGREMLLSLWKRNE